MRNSHYSKRKLHPKVAEQNYIRYVVQEMQDFGLHLISGTWSRDDKIELSVSIGISLNGIKIFERSVEGKNNQRSRKCGKRLLYEAFDWVEIENIYFSKQILCIVVRKSWRMNLNQPRLKFKFKMDSRK